MLRLTSWRRDWVKWYRMDLFSERSSLWSRSSETGILALSKSGTVGLMPQDMFGGLVERVGVEEFSVCLVKAGSISRRLFGDYEVCGSVVEVWWKVLKATQMCLCTKRTAWNNSFLIYQKSIAFVRSVPSFYDFTNGKRKFVITLPRSGVCIYF